MRSVHSGATWWSSCSFGCILVRSVGRRARLGVFGTLPYALEVVRGPSSPFRPTRGRRVRSHPFRLFTCALEVFGFVRERSFYYRTPLGSSCSFGCVGSIPWSPRGRRDRSGPFGPFPRSLRGVGFAREHSVHSRAQSVVQSMVQSRVQSSGFTVSPTPRARGNGPNAYERNLRHTEMDLTHSTIPRAHGNGPNAPERTPGRT